MDKKQRKNITLSPESIEFLERLSGLVQDEGNLSQGIELAVSHLKGKIKLNLEELNKPKESNDT